jgi:nucleoside 2-deoxyribosyltransferase
MSDPYFYIASPFFNAEQLNTVESIKDILDDNNLTYFSPKDECMYKEGETTPEEVLEINIMGLNKTDICVCVTDGKDPGTMFEAGWCYAKGIPLIYVWLGGLPGQKFNLVLAASGSVVRSYEQLDLAIKEIKDVGAFIRRNWSEEKIDYE